MPKSQTETKIMSTPTAARPTQRKDSHWYDPASGEPRYEIMGKTTGKPRPVTLRDARENNWVPSVTNILKLLHKEGLVNWMIEQAVLACTTTPRGKDEDLDTYINRVLHVEQVQNQEAAKARDIGTELHGALDDYFCGRPVPDDLRAWILPMVEKLETYGSVVASELIVVGNGYAGKTDLVLQAPDCWWIWDYKSTKNLPDPKKGGAWMEHRLQAAAYAAGLMQQYANDPERPKKILTGNAYISSVNPGEFVICEHSEPWETVYNFGFAPLVTHWQWAANYRPHQEIKSEAPQVDADEPPVQTAAQLETTNLKGRKVVWTPGTKA